MTRYKKNLFDKTNFEKKNLVKRNYAFNVKEEIPKNYIILSISYIYFLNYQ